MTDRPLEHEMALAADERPVEPLGAPPEGIPPNDTLEDDITLPDSMPAS